MTPPFPMMIMKAFIQEVDDLAYQITFPIKPALGSNQPEHDVTFKLLDPPIVRSFNYSTALGSTSSTLTETVHWLLKYTGAETGEIKASANNMLLVVMNCDLSGTGSNYDIRASASIDTADGTLIYNAACLIDYRPSHL